MSLRSSRAQLEYDLLFRFFLDMSLNEPSFDASSFAKNKQRLLEAEVARHFFEGVVGQARSQGLMSAEHFTVDGTLIEAGAGVKSFKDGPDPRGAVRPARNRLLQQPARAAAPSGACARGSPTPRGTTGSRTPPA
uniref:transposase n=1 Tax=Corallococcus coralloides TaxID=184914 RepID=UPI000FFED55C|nr:transposase [Corallococcus coralloides]